MSIQEKKFQKYAQELVAQVVEVRVEVTFVPDFWNYGDKKSVMLCNLCWSATPLDSTLYSPTLAGPATIYVSLSCQPTL